MAMYKNRNTGTRNGIRGTRGIGGMLYSGECCQIFWGMSLNIPGNVPKYSGECRKNSVEFRRTFRGMSPNIPGNVTKHSGEYHQRFRRMPTTGWLSNSMVGRLTLDTVLLNYLLFTVDFTMAKKSTKIIVKCLVVKCYYTFCQANR